MMDIANKNNIHIGQQLCICSITHWSFAKQYEKAKPDKKKMPERVKPNSVLGGRCPDVKCQAGGTKGAVGLGHKITLGVIWGSTFTWEVASTARVPGVLMRGQIGSWG